MTQCKIPGKILVTLAPKYQVWKAAASMKETSRPVLNGVYLDPEGYMVATDSYILAVVPCKTEGKIREGVIIPASFLSSSHKSRINRGEDIPFFSLELDGVHVSTAIGDPVMTTILIPGTYFNWRNLIPRLADMGASVRQVIFDPRLVGRLAQAIGVTCPIIIPGQKDSPAVIPTSGKAFGLLMPMSAPQVDRAVLASIARLHPPVRKSGNRSSA